MHSGKESRLMPDSDEGGKILALCVHCDVQTVSVRPDRGVAEMVE
jgi:hypothetical protein